LVLQPGRAVPAQRGPGEADYRLVVPIRAGGRVRALTAEADHPFDAELAEVLVELGAVLSAPLSTEGIATRRAAGQALLDLEADRAQTAADLDAVADGLVAARHALAEAGSPTEAIDRALLRVRVLRRDLRAQALDAGPAAALRSLGFSLTGDIDVLARLTPPAAIAVQRIAEAIARRDEPVQTVAHVTELAVKFRVESAEKVCDASELERWDRRVSALGGELLLHPGGVELLLPQPRHVKDTGDHSPDL
jgi:hypothetical protein